jgi:hypothetical protein
VVFAGVFFYNTDSYSTCTIVEVFEDGSFEIVGEVDPVLKSFGIKTSDDLIKTYLMRHSCQLHPDSYDWPAAEQVESLVYSCRGDLDRSAAIEAAHYYRPRFMGDQVEIYMNLRDMQRNRRTKIRFGRFMRILLPKATDAQIEQIQNKYRERFIQREFTLHRGKSREDFRLAYNGTCVKSLNPRTNSTRKSLSNSCMQDMNIGGYSPAESYASGDFEILYLLDDKEHVAARVVVYVGGEGKPQSGPIYGSCEHSMDLLQAELDAMEAVTYEDASWKGAKLAKIEVYGGDYLICYCDLEGEAYDDGDYFIIGRGNIEICTTQGYTGSNRAYCCSCDNTIDEDEAYFNRHGDCYCESCYNDNYAICTLGGHEFDSDDAVDVLTSNSRYYYSASVANPRGITIDGSDVDYSECPYTGELWLLEDMEIDVDGDSVSPRYALNSMVIVDGELYSPEQLKEHGFDADGNKIEDDLNSEADMQFDAIESAEEEEKEEAA